MSALASHQTVSKAAHRANMLVIKTANGKMTER